MTSNNKHVEKHVNGANGKKNVKRVITINKKGNNRINEM